MPDRLTREQRSLLMASIRGKDTRPERLVRGVLHRMGFRFRLHRRDLPGKPDVVLPRWRTILFVHGCFWHQHHDCKGATTPRSHSDFWREKFARNAERDARVAAQLRDLGWRVEVVWECETRKPELLAERLYELLVRESEWCAEE
jgi:DNA mismatch endonuclease (patch repair protein)